MPSPVGGARRVPCAGAVIHDEAGRLLLIRRGRPPGAGLWSVPGGRVETGETVEAAVARETLEETGLRVAVGRRLGVVQRPGPNGTVYEIADHECAVLGGVPVAGDDAAEVGWFAAAELNELPLVVGLLDELRAWGALGPVRAEVQRPGDDPPLEG